MSSVQQPVYSPRTTVWRQFHEVAWHNGRWFKWVEMPNTMKHELPSFFWWFLLPRYKKHYINCCLVVVNPCFGEGYKTEPLVSRIHICLFTSTKLLNWQHSTFLFHPVTIFRRKGRQTWSLSNRDTCWDNSMSWCVGINIKSMKFNLIV